MNKQAIRRLLFTAVLALSSLSCATAQIIQQSYLIDVGSSQTTFDPTTTWNNLTTAIGITDTGVLPNLVATDSTPSLINLQMVARFNGENQNGTLTSTLYPATATRDSLFGNTEPFGTPAIGNIFPKFKLTNLDPSKAYNLTFYASRTGVSDNRETGYTVNGGISGFAALNVTNNVDNVAQVFGITPDATGEILVSLAPTANNNNSNHFTYLGVMRLDVVPEPSVALALVSGVGMLVVVRRRKA